MERKQKNWLVMILFKNKKIDMRRIIIFTVALILTSCDVAFHEKEHSNVVSPSIVVVSVDYLESSPEIAKYGIVCIVKLKHDDGFSDKSRTIYYYDAAGKFNVGDEIVFEKKEHYEDEEADRD